MNLALATSLLSACTQADPQPATSFDTLADGRVIALNTSPETTESKPVWSTELVTTLQTSEDDSVYFARIVDIALGPQGRVYVLDSRATRVGVFDSDGSFLHFFGTRGEGPGELMRPYALRVTAAGEVWVADSRLRRYSVYSPDGRFLRSQAGLVGSGARSGLMKATGSALLDFGSVSERVDYPDGSMTVNSLGTGAFRGRFGTPPRSADTLLLGTWRRPGFSRVDGGTTETTTLIMAPPFAPGRQLEFSPDGSVWTADGDVYAVHKLTFDGDTVLTVQRRVGPPVLSPGDSRFIEQLGQRMTADGYAPEPGAALPSTYPFVDRIVVAEDGSLWVARRTAAGTSFDVFDGNGRFLASLPTDLRVGAGGVHPVITADRLIAVRLDSLDVPHVEVHRILRP